MLPPMPVKRLSSRWRVARVGIEIFGTTAVSTSRKKRWQDPPPVLLGHPGSTVKSFLLAQTALAVLETGHPSTNLGQVSTLEDHPHRILSPPIRPRSGHITTPRSITAVMDLATI